MSQQMKLKVKYLIGQINGILMRTLEFEEDRTGEIEAARDEWICTPFNKMYDGGLCQKIKEEQVVETYVSYISGKEK